MQIALSKPQYDFLTSSAEIACFSAGIGSGKSFVGAAWAKDQLSLEPKAKGFIGANTYNQLQNATLASFFGVLDDFGIPYRYNRQRNIIRVAGRTVYAYSLENYDAIRGIE